MQGKTIKSAMIRVPYGLESWCIEFIAGSKSGSADQGQDPNEPEGDQSSREVWEMPQVEPSVALQLPILMPELGIVAAQLGDGQAQSMELLLLLAVGSEVTSSKPMGMRAVRNSCQIPKKKKDRLWQA